LATAEGLILVLSGPGGAGKGTIARALAGADESIHLSRSWTTRAPRPGEDGEDYEFVDEPRFRAHIEADGFLEWAEFLGHLYGTPRPSAERGADLLLEIDLEGAKQVLSREPRAKVVLLLPPSPEIQEARLRARGDDEEHILRRLAKGREEEALGLDLAHYVVYNHDLTDAIGELRGIIEVLRAQES